MEQDQDQLELARARIALYRQYFKEGVPSELVGPYMRELRSAEKELERLTGEQNKPPSTR